jgi:hypothetical protein
MIFFGCVPVTIRPPISTLSPVCTSKRVEMLANVVGLGVGIGVGAGVAVAVAVAVGMGVGVDVGVVVAVGVGVGVDVGVAVAVGVGVGGVPAGSNEATVTVLPSITAALPAVKFVALVLMIRTFEVVPGSSFELSGGKNENPITSPVGALRSAPSGGTVPSMKGPDK